jgi:hypothetical protein
MVTNNGHGFYLFWLSNSNNIYHNNIIDNIDQVYSDGLNIWDDGDGKGNYWSDYEGLDDGSLDPRTGEPRPEGDGVGDTSIPHQDVDWFPLMDLWDLVDEIKEIIEDIKEMELLKGPENALISILEAAINSLENGNYNTAMNQLEAFIHMVEAFRGTKLTDEEADELIAMTYWVIDNLLGE